jgi:hypothetical protein
VNARALLALLSVLLPGCTVVTIPGPLTVTTKPLPELSGIGGKEVRGKSCGRVLLGLIPLGYSSADAAWREALESAPGTDTLLRYETRITDVFVSPVYAQFCTEIHGYAVSSQTLSGAVDGVSPRDP